MKNKQIIGIVVAGIVFIAVCVTGTLSNVFANKMLDSSKNSSSTWTDLLKGAETEVSLPTEDFIGVINIVGEIGPSDSNSNIWETTADGQYDHNTYMNYIDQLIDTENNKGILLYANSPGGTVYESDELYLKLMEYKEATGRPIYAYFASQACSGAYYISMAADKIYANRNCWTGSIGVIVSLVNCKKLYDKIGLKEIDITSGKNKSMGSAGLNLTEEQYDILQSLVDEAYDQFAEIVSNGRSMDIAQVKKLADGRIYSAKQAKEANLVDEVGLLTELKAAMQEDNGLASDITYHEVSRSSNFLNTLMGKVNGLLPKSDLELAKDITENKGNGVLKYYAD